MNKARTLICIFSAVLFAGLSFMCVSGFLYSTETEIKIQFAACLLRSFVFLLFLFLYVFIFCENLGLDSVFIPLFLFSSLASELTVTDLFAQTVIYYPVSPALLSSVLVFFSIFSTLMLFGYGFFYQERERSVILLFLFAASVFSFVLTCILPKSQNPQQLNTNTTLTLLLISLYAGTGTLFLKNLIKDAPESSLLRHFAALLFLIYSVIIHYFIKGIIHNVTITAFVFVSYILIIIIAKTNNSKF